MADVCFSKMEVIISQPSIDMSTKFGLVIDFDLLKAVTSTNTKPYLVFSGRGRHLDKWKYTGNLLTVVMAHYTHS